MVALLVFIIGPFLAGKNCSVITFSKIRLDIYVIRETIPGEITKMWKFKK